MATPPRTKVGIVFDDGFRASSLETARIFEHAGLRAVFAVLADPTGFAPNFPVGDFPLWNELQHRGHVIHPHGLHHTNLTTLPLAQATAQIDQCLARFAENLDGFDPRRAVWHYAYNSNTPDTNAYLLNRVRAVRGQGDGFLDPATLASGAWHSRTFGPGDPTDDLLAHLHLCRTRRPPAFIYSLHGLDGEAWGAVPSATLRRVLDTLLTDEALEYWSVGATSPAAPR
jgi:peptidoglycan/xylan/chitin deacetylase (PgdA/CDA1 family)